MRAFAFARCFRCRAVIRERDRARILKEAVTGPEIVLLRIAVSCPACVGRVVGFSACRAEAA